MGPYQPDMLEYPGTKFGSQNRRFQKKWFQKFYWLEYSPSTNKVYCFYCFLFLNDVNSSNISALVNEGFDNWKRVNQGKTCAFLSHIGSAASSPYTMCERRAENLMRPSQHIDKVMHAQSKEEKEKNRLRLSTSIVVVRWLALQGCAFRGNDESLSSSNRGNFLELVKAFAKMNIEIDEVVLENAPKNAQYIAPEIQKEILHIMANRVRKMVREEVGDKYFCILVDEARDISKREQMAIILRFVNNHGILTERFFAIKSVSDTTSMNLKNEISNILVHHDLHVKKIRGQGYDAKDVSVIWEFFSHLDNIVNIVTSSTKRIAELHTTQRNEIEYMLSIGERDSGSGANQIGNLQRAGATRWSSHYDSVKSLIGMYTATCKVFEVLSDHSPNGRAKAEVRGIYRNMASFEFVFILHLMHKIMRTTDTLCQILQKKSQDILTAITFVTTTKTCLQKFRECGWNEFLQEVKVFCSRNEIAVPDLDCLYKIGRSLWGLVCEIAEFLGFVVGSSTVIKTLKRPALNDHLSSRIWMAIHIEVDENCEGLWEIGSRFGSLGRTFRSGITNKNVLRGSEDCSTVVPPTLKLENEKIKRILCVFRMSECMNE
ncbi:uncharacterized protein [Primulina eburnea]|uniref:uncharacterized protein n=1 Tax=Primulina eburnea TaxID=1245227 RepID=UPI003C6C168E